MAIAEFQKIKKLLEESKVQFEVHEHEPVFTSEQAAKVRGVEMKTGVKAIVMANKKGNYLMALVPADRKIDAKKLGELSGFGRMSFAKPEEVIAVTNCESGSVPPFGNIWNLPTFADKRLLENEEANFNVGLHTHSVKMKLKDLVEIVKPVIGDFAI